MLYTMAIGEQHEIKFTQLEFPFCVDFKDVVKCFRLVCAMAECFVV